MAAAKEYARALFMLSEEFSRTDAVLNDAKILAQIFKNNPDYIKLLDTPAIVKAEKIKLIDEAFKDIDEYLLNVLKMLCEEHCVHILPKVIEEFFFAYNQARGIEEVEAVTAVAMTDSQLERMKEKLENMTGKRIVIKNTVDKSILGGVKLRYLGIQLDGSVKTKLDKFSQALKNTVI